MCITRLRSPGWMPFKRTGILLSAASASSDCCGCSTILSPWAPMYKADLRAWKTWDAFSGDQRFRFEDEAEGFELHFRALSGSFAHEPKRWQDAYFAAFALATDVELVTFDTSFRSFAGLCHRILGP